MSTVPSSSRYDLSFTDEAQCSSHLSGASLNSPIADKAFKERRVVSLTEVAQATGVHRATLSKMANQPGANIGTEIVDKLCRYFGCQPGGLLAYVGEDVGPQEGG